MAASLPRPACRLFRTYGGAGGREPRRLPGRTAAQWFRPNGRGFLFSSSSGNDTSGSGSSPSGGADDLDADPDFLGSPVRARRRRRAGGRGAKDTPSPAATPQRARLRARPPQNCSTPCGPHRLPPFPGPDLGDCGQPPDGSELGTSTSLFSLPASPGPRRGSPALGESVRMVTTPSTTLDAASDVPRVPAATVDLSSPLPCPLESRLDHQTSGSLRSALFDSRDSEEDTADSELRPQRKTGRGSGWRRQPSRKRLKSPRLSSHCKKRAKGPAPCPKEDSQGAALRDCEELRGRRNCTVPVESNRPRRNGSCRKRKQETMATSPPLHCQQLEQGMEKEARSTQDLTPLQNACSWVKTRASFSFHKKKIVTATSEVCSSSTAANCSSNTLLSEFSNPPVSSGRSSALASWRSSSMYLLSPIKMLCVADKKASDAEKVYRECNQEGPVPFCYYTEKLECCQKIGEGVFGEVFEVTVNHTLVALKIIAIEGPCLVNGAHQKTFEEILPEIIISKELSLLSDELVNRTEGFIGLNSVHCVQGSYPPLLLRAWDKYNSTKGSANDRPDFFEVDQLFIVLEFEFGGTDLEQMKSKLSSLATAKSILHQITASLAVAEASLHFEHRDLHWGNVLLKKTPLKELHYTLNGETRSIPTQGLQVNIIDYTLSRLERDGIVIFCDISKDEDLFTGQGDYQFEIYRLMRKENNNRWGEYHPYNNVLWLHYLTDKILKEMTYKTKSSSSTMKQMKRKIQHFHRTMLNFSSATDLLCQHCLFQ
ncbi:serine/threonine-protein kinase haspin [Sorex araneus]|uniref:serine/threonine-protein kinase haspin n=1 Tax=Sorex araneus TaxID=42254 RepID=UPI002433ED27|nr:serine/threonine-protein kinase haspin [Sorex araneus]